MHSNENEMDYMKIKAACAEFLRGKKQAHTACAFATQEGSSSCFNWPGGNLSTCFGSQEDT